MPDFLVGAWSAWSQGPQSGRVLAFSGRELSLRSTTHEVSLTTGGSQPLSLDLGGNAAGQLFVGMGSVSGTSPGFRLGSVVIPTNIDFYWIFTTSNPNTILRPSVGFLNQAGRTSAQVVIPSGLHPALVGLRLDHAFVALSSSTLAPIAASDPVVLTLVR